MTWHSFDGISCEHVLASFGVSWKGEKDKGDPVFILGAMGLVCLVLLLGCGWVGLMD